MLSRSRVTVVVTLTAVLLMIALALADGPASADSRGADAPAADTITIKTPVTVTALGGAGGERLAVTAVSTTALTSMTVHLLDGTATADTFTMTMTSSTPGATSTASTWTSGAITTQSLPLGDYSLTVDAADQGGTTITAVPAGTLAFLDTPRITPAAGDYVISAANKHPLINGTITELAPGAATATPYANQPIVLDDPVGGNIRLTTNGAGSYREALPKATAGETITAEVPPTPTTQATKAKPVTLTAHTAITGFTAKLNPFWQVTYHGCLGLTAGTPGHVPALAGLAIQYSAGPHGPWHALGAVPAQGGKVCGNDGRTFTGVLTAQRANAFYRASYAATAARQAATGDLPSAGGVVHAWKYVTRITGFTVSERTVASGGKLTATGRLQYESDGKWRNVARQTVQIILLPKGSKTWYWIARVMTNPWGKFTSTVTDPVSATWSAEYLGNGSHLAAVGAYIPVTLTS
jgi:hypothetical protein